MDGQVHIPAAEVSQVLLDITGEALMDGDFEKFAACFQVPNTISTFDSVNQIETIGDLQRVFDGVHDFLKTQGVTKLIRICTEATYKSPDRVEAAHESHLFAGSSRVTEPSVALSDIRRIDGAWKVCRSQYAVAHAPVLNRALGGSPDREPSKPKEKINE